MQRIASRTQGRVTILRWWRISWRADDRVDWLRVSRCTRASRPNWAIVTLTTVGYGDIAPTTVLGQMLASVMMILGYSIIAVPTGIVTVELSKATRGQVSTQACPQCSAEGHDADAKHCKYCGARL